jgi:uncharacterized protein
MSRVLHRVVAVVLAGAFLFGASAAAQSAKPDPARVVLARQVLDAGGTVETMVAAIRANLPAQRAATPQVPAEFWPKFEARLVEEVPRLVDSVAVLYAQKFTSEELNSLLAFYRSPTGRRLKALQPTLVQETAGIGQRWGMRIGQEVGATLVPR